MPAKMKKVLIIRLNAMGDVILALPVAVAIKAHSPDIIVDFATRKEYAPIFDQFPAVDTAYSFEGGTRELLRKLKRQKYDTVIDLQKNPRSIILTAGINPKNVVSYPKRRLKRELIIRKPHLGLDAGHTVDAYLKALNRLKIKSVTRRPRVELQPEIVEFGEDFVRRIGFTGKVIGLCPGSKHAEKRWQGYEALARLLIAEGETGVIVFSGPHDSFSRDLNIHSDRLVAAHSLNLDKVAGVMKKCDVVVTNDSGLMHLAVALSVPVVAIFGPTHPSLGFSPLGEYDRVICDNVACSPCSLHGEKSCRMPHKYCFEQITADRLKAEVDKVLYAESASKIL
jgi:heptosyltransferase-2